MRVLYQIAVFLILMFWHLTGMAQMQAAIKLDTNSILIGDQTSLTLSFTLPVKNTVQWPHFGDTLTGNIEIVSRSGIDSAFSNNNTDITYIQKLLITSFDSGYYAIPPVRFYYTAPGDTARHFIESDAELLEVHTIKVDSQGNFKDIKEPLDAPFTLLEALPWILGLMALSTIIVFVILYLKKRKSQQPFFKAPARPQLPPHQVALDALDELRYKKLWQNGKIKLYHTELTDILREYLTSKFGFQAMELTSDEIMESMVHTPVNAEAKDKLKQTLMLADLVKFAKMQPLPLEHDASLNNAIDFVKETIHLYQPEPKNKIDGNQAEQKPAEEGILVPENKSDVLEEGKEVRDV